MKDNEVRGRFFALESDVQSLKIHIQVVKKGIGKLEECFLEGISVRDCPVCKHETLQKVGRKKPPPKPWCTLIYWEEDYFDYLCLNCGVKLVCETKTECKVLKEVKDEG